MIREKDVGRKEAMRLGVSTADLFIPHDYQTPIPFQASNIENVDSAMFDYIKKLNISTTTHRGFEPVSLVWVSPERSLAAKRELHFRDNSGALILPIVAVERTGIVKDLNKKGAVWANIVPHFDEKGGSIRIARRIKQDKTSNFVNARTKKKRGQINFPGQYKDKVVYETLTIPQPVYVEMTYKITIRTEYQQQMNDIITPFITTPGGVNYILVSRHGHRYEGFIQQDFSHNNNYTSFSKEERRLETTIDIKILAYLIGEGPNAAQPTYSIRENAVDIKMPRERLVFSESPEHEHGRFYGLAGVVRLIDKGEADFQVSPFVFDRGAESSGGGGGGTTTSVAVAGSITTTNYTPNGEFQQTGDGSRTTFTVSEAFVIGTQQVFRDGVLMSPGEDNDYTVTDNRTIEFNDEEPPRADENLHISYVKA
tara:strand:- start:790 stop:2064 length:1275 start_codon:yes stop_codon:yes gene_type:complete